MIIEGSRTYDNKIYEKISYTHRSMMARCYNKKNSSYKNYGGIGVRVSERWKSLNNFIEDFDKIEGYDFDGVFNGQLQLDKDIKQKDVPDNKKIYSIETCLFVSPSKNSENRKNNKEMIIISPNGKIFYSSNRDKFCREHNLSSRNAWQCLTSKSTHYLGWQFFYTDSFNEENVMKPKKVKAISPNKDIYYFNNMAIFAKSHNLSSPNISMVLSGKNKTHKGWTFELINDGFILQSEHIFY